MKGILLSEANGAFTIVDTLEKPKPGKNQILVKSLVAGLNPVEAFMRAGALVTAWPIVLGCDASGIVVEVGNGVTKFKEGDKVFGCTRLGIPQYGTFQEYFLMDEHLTFKTPANVSLEQAATIGVGILTATLALISGMNIELKAHPVGDEWVIILGAAGGVGQFAVQLAKLCGYKVLASCSPVNGKIVQNLGADAMFSYKLPLNEQLKEIASITGKKFSKVFDASGMASETGMEALAQCGDPAAETKYFSTTNDWVPIEPKEGIEIYDVTLGVIGRSGDEHILEVNQDMEDFIPKLEEFISNGSIKPMEYEVVADVGMQSVLKGLDAFSDKKSSSKKMVVKVADE